MTVLVLLLAAAALAEDKPADKAAKPVDGPAIKKQLTERLDQPPPTDAEGLTKLGDEVGKRLEELEKTSPRAQSKIKALRDKLAGLSDRMKSNKRDRGVFDPCAKEELASAKRAACLTDGLKSAVQGLELGDDTPAAGERERTAVAAPNGMVPALSPAFTDDHARAELTRLARAAGARRFYQGELGAQELPAAISAFQKRSGLDESGALDEATREALRKQAEAARAASTTAPQRGDEHESVGRLQQVLRKIAPGLTIDNKFGDKTHQAMEQVRQRYGEEVAAKLLAYAAAPSAQASPRGPVVRDVPSPVTREQPLGERVTTSVSAALKSLREFHPKLPQAALDRLAAIVAERPQLAERKTEPDPRLGRGQDLDPHVAVMNADMPGREKRLALINLAKIETDPHNAVTWMHVSDGRGRGYMPSLRKVAPARNAPGAERYENVPESNLTPSGPFLVPSRTEGTYGGALRLKGLTPQNANASNRGILVHRRFGGDNIWSSGCLRVPNTKEVLAKLRSGAIYIYRSVTDQ